MATQPPIIVEPPGAGVVPGATVTLRVMLVLGTIVASIADPTVATISVDQTERTLRVTGLKGGNTTITVRDERGLTRDVGVRVAELAGTIPAAVSIRGTGHPATQLFLRDRALAAAIAAAVPKPGASIVASADSVNVSLPLKVDDVTTIDVPVIITGDNYFTAQGTTHVRVENFAQPVIRPQSLLVSDYPETLKENGILFTADLDTKRAERFLYYHYNPATQPDRRIVLKVQNMSQEPATVQFIAGTAGPESNELEVGHLSTQRFLVRLAQNEGSVVTIPGNATVSLLSQSLPARTVASGIMQLHEIDGAPLHLTLVAQDAGDPIDGPIPTSALLVGDRPHARGIYPIPEFYFDYNYDAEGPDVEVPIGQIPLPNLVQGQTLAGDYGVLQSVTIRMVNNDRRNARQIALYASPRGGRATGTFVIDRVLVQAHTMAAYGHYKLRQYTIPPGSFVCTEIVTMPEGGSSYPLRLIVAPDDGSAPPGSSDSPVY
ncbi:MAG: Ig-like domain-containing protein [Candidatus Eremiobacteraeota bacterium]|nr:Ig-like domain-containing protein [Candidatus Eremiobacteraeota bacterium]